LRQQFWGHICIGLVNLSNIVGGYHYQFGVVASIDNAYGQEAVYKLNKYIYRKFAAKTKKILSNVTLILTFRHYICFY
jgi:hypothetical protein